MAGCWPYRAGGCKKNECDHIENNQFQFFNDQLYASTASSWQTTDNQGWENTNLSLTPQSTIPEAMVPLQQHTYLDPLSDTYGAHTFVHNQHNSTTVNPQSLQVPTFVKPSGFEAPFLSSPFDTSSGLESDAGYGFTMPEPLSDQCMVDDTIGQNGLPAQYLEAMNSTVQSELSGGDQPSSFADDFDDELTTANSSPAKKKKRRLTKTQTTVLRNWFYFHIENPYPDPDEMARLQAETQLSLEQVRNWFARTRQRQLPVETTASGRTPNSTYQQTFSSTIPFRRGRSSPIGDRGRSSPINFHQNTFIQSVANEAVHNVANADMNAQNRGSKDRVYRTRAPTITIDTSHLVPPDDTQFILDDNLVQTPSITASPTNLAPDYSDAGSEYDNPVLSRRGSCRSLSSFKSCRSHQSNHSGSSVAIHGSRRGRRRMTSGSRSPSEASSLRDYVENPNEMVTRGDRGDEYCCRLCSETFTRKSTLKRHLQTIHGLERRPWVCNLPNLGDLSFPQCFFCLMGELVRVCPHRIDACEHKSRKDRSFWRKDHFMQHLEGVHKISKEFVRQCEIDLNQWRSPEMMPAAPEVGRSSLQNTVMPSQPIAAPSTGGRIKQTISSGWKNFVHGNHTSS